MYGIKFKVTFKIRYEFESDPKPNKTQSKMSGSLIKKISKRKQISFNS